MTKRPDEPEELSPAADEAAAMRAALAQFSLRTDLTVEARTALATALAGSAGEFGALADGRLCLTPRGLAVLIGLGSGGVVTLRQWRRKHLGPPVAEQRFGAQLRVLYPVEGVQRWLRESITTFRLHADAQVLGAFGLTVPAGEEAAA